MNYFGNSKLKSKQESKVSYPGVQAEATWRYRNGKEKKGEGRRLVDKTSAAVIRTWNLILRIIGKQLKGFQQRQNKLKIYLKNLSSCWEVNSIGRGKSGNVFQWAKSELTLPGLRWLCWRKVSRDKNFSEGEMNRIWSSIGGWKMNKGSLHLCLHRLKGWWWILLIGKKMEES